MNITVEEAIENVRRMYSKKRSLIFRDKPKFCGHCGWELNSEIYTEDEIFDRKTGRLLSVVFVRRYKCTQHRYMSPDEHDDLEYKTHRVSNHKVLRLMMPWLVDKGKL